MPIYAYKCDACGLTKDVLQKISDPQLTDCPSCGQSTFRKQVTAAGFQLKGSGWYVTDFRGGNSATGSPAPATTASSAAEGASTGTSGDSKSAAAPAVASDSKSSASTSGDAK